MSVETYMPILEFKDVTKVLKSGFARRPLYKLGPLSLEVEAGEIFGYLGPNGAGKTTSIKLAMGILRPDSGEVRFFGGSSRRNDIRRRTGFLPEGPYFYQHLTAFELLDFYGELSKIPRRTRRQRAMDLLHLTGLGEFAETRISKFSKGMLQRVGFAQALINDPEILILDEPLSGLDPVGRRQIRDLILGLKSGGKTVFFSSHILQDVEMICDRVGILLGGKLLRAATMDDILLETLEWVEIAVDDLMPETIRQMGIAGVEDKGGRTLVRLAPHENLSAVIKSISGAGGRVMSVIPHRQTLEDYFMRNVELGEPAFEGALIEDKAAWLGKRELPAAGYSRADRKREKGKVGIAN
jgi:ABC-2 type transport system ATP-binding protein